MSKRIVSAAGRELGEAESTISAAIANLETDLGVDLFDRSNRSPALTASGHKLLRQAEAVLERCMTFEAHADCLSDDVEPSLTLAIETPYGPIMSVLKAFEEAFPFVDLIIRHPVYGDVSELVSSGEAILGVAFSQPDYPNELAFQQLGKLIMLHVCHPDHPLAQLDNVSFEDLHVHRRLAFSAHASKRPAANTCSRPSCGRRKAIWLYWKWCAPASAGPPCPVNSSSANWPEVSW